MRDRSNPMTPGSLIDALLGPVVVLARVRGRTYLLWPTEARWL